MGTKRGDSQVDRGLQKGKRYPKAQNPNVKRGSRVAGEKQKREVVIEEEPKVSDTMTDAPPPPQRRTLKVGEIEIDYEALFEAAKTHASYKTLALIFGIGEMTMRNNFAHIIEEARAHKQKELLTAQFDTAITDRNPTMQIWLGKQYLEQKDVSRVEQSGPDGGPQKSEVTQKVVAYIPDNQRDS